MFMAICKPAIYFSLIATCVQTWAAPSTLSRARQLYKEGQYLKAAEAYERIEMDSPDYLRTREELAWSYLRAGEWTKLRGVLAHLNSSLVPLRWRLEGRVMSAMINLRECQYERVKQELDQFRAELGPFVKKVDGQLSRSSHREYWTALRGEIEEALLKMKFVRMELRSRLVMLGREQVVQAENTKGLSERISSGQQTFPLERDVWVDEVFHARGSGTVACAQIHKSKVAR